MTIGVLVMAYGGPDSLADVEPYLIDVRGGRPTPRRTVDAMTERYRRIGGRSPIRDRTRAQAAAIQTALDTAEPGRFQCVVGMKHWTPRIHDALKQLRQRGIRRAVGLVMAPHFSYMSIGGYWKRVHAADLDIEVARIDRWHLLPAFVTATAGRINSALSTFDASVRPDVPVLFTAHSLPERIREQNDPYPDELRETVAAVAGRLGQHVHSFAYQSAAMTREPWLGPDASERLREYAAEGRPGVVMAPIGFTSDHVEILFDIDIEYQALARELALPLVRMEMLNDDARAMTALAGLVTESAGGMGWLD